jgi:hypothetical protein
MEIPISYIIAVFSMVFMYIYFMIDYSLGFSNLYNIYQAKKGQKKGVILINLYKDDGTSEFRLGQKKGSELIMLRVNKKDKDSIFVLNSECIYRRFGINMVDYFEKDIDPRDWRTGQIATTSPIALQNIITNATKAELLSDSFIDFIRRNLVYILMAIVGIIAILGFVIITQNDQLLTLTGQYFSDRVITSQ